MTGLLVKPNEPDRLAQALARVLFDPRLRAEMGARAEEQSPKCFEFGLFCAAITQLHAELIRS